MALVRETTSGWKNGPCAIMGNLSAGWSVAPRSPGESFTKRERQLLPNIASQAGATAFATRLLTALQRSREKLVLAREEEWSRKLQDYSPLSFRQKLGKAK